ncbi:MAG TPA: FDLD family class I lanthipeptide [Bacillus sp. (in: firmicutes)]|nr:FDLD family class I lanthipeptide [Bacillus sp. (in: firmicutes)]
MAKNEFDLDVQVNKTSGRVQPQFTSMSGCDHKWTTTCTDSCITKDSGCFTNTCFKLC